MACYVYGLSFFLSTFNYLSKILPTIQARHSRLANEALLRELTGHACTALPLTQRIAMKSASTTKWKLSNHRRPRMLQLSKVNFTARVSWLIARLRLRKRHRRMQVRPKSGMHYAWPFILIKEMSHIPVDKFGLLFRQSQPRSSPAVFIFVVGNKVQEVWSWRIPVTSGDGGEWWAENILSPRVLPTHLEPSLLTGHETSLG